MDESLYAMPAWNLVANGSFGMPVVEPAHYTIMPGWPRIVPGIHEHDLMHPPAGLLAQAAWYRAFGCTLLSARAFSMAWSVVALASLYGIVTSLTGDRILALLASALAGMDQTFLARATMARIDMLCAALVFAALAVYLRLREKHLGRAILAGESLVVLSGLAHPNGGLLGLVALTLLGVYLDRKRFEWKHAGIALLPYAAGALAMGAFIRIDPEAFRAQFFGGSAGRLDGLRSPLEGFWRELTVRYAAVYGLGAGASPPGRIKLLVLAGYAGAAVMIATRRSLRRQTGYRTLLLLALAQFLALAAIDNSKFEWYLVYVIPFWSALAAVCAAWWWRAGRRAAAGAAVAVLVAIPLAATVRNILKNPYRHDYLPTARFVRARCGPGGRVMGSAALAFELGIGDTLVDDYRLGYYSGKRFDIVVADDGLWGSLENVREIEPQVYRHVMATIKNDFRPAFRASSYTVYLRRR